MELIGESVRLEEVANRHSNFPEGRVKSALSGTVRLNGAGRSVIDLIGTKSAHSVKGYLTGSLIQNKRAAVVFHSGNLADQRCHRVVESIDNNNKVRAFATCIQMGKRISCLLG